MLQEAVGESDLQPAHHILVFTFGKRTWCMSNPPHRFKRCGILCEPGDKVPMDMGQLVPQQFIIDFDRSEFFRKMAGHRGDFLNEASPLILRQLKELSGMPFEHQHGPSGEKLILMELSHRLAAIRNEMVVPRPLAGAGFA